MAVRRVTTPLWPTGLAYWNGALLRNHMAAMMLGPLLWRMRARTSTPWSPLSKISLSRLHVFSLSRLSAQQDMARHAFSFLSGSSHDEIILHDSSGNPVVADHPPIVSRQAHVAAGRLCLQISMSA